MRSNREEIVRPVATVIKVRDYDEALATASDVGRRQASARVRSNMLLTSAGTQRPEWSW
jgi:acyl-CoA reductase-like NAD-dependent aldehyde dehydrogenase